MMAKLDAIPIGELLSELARRLDQLGPAGVRTALERHARSLRPSQRAGFLDVFAASSPAGSSEDLLDEVERVVGELDDLSPRQWDGYRSWRDDGEDDEYAMESADIDDLLIAAGERFLAGDVDVAVAAYRRLFDAIVSTVDDDRGVTLAPDVELIAEAATRLMWNVVRTAPDRVADVVDDYRLVAPMPSLAAILHAHPDFGPPAADALRTAADALMDRSANRPEWEARQSFGLALEMRAHVDGLDAVVAMARADTPERLEVTAWAVDRLVEGGRLEEAAALAHDTMAVTASSHRLAVLADTAANVDAQLGRPAFAAAATAWAAHPTISRLEAVLDAARPNERTSFIAATAEHPPTDRFLATATRILAGDVPAAATGALDAATLDWGRAALRLAVVACCATAGPTTMPLAEPALAAAYTTARRQAHSWLPEAPAPGTPLVTHLRRELARVEPDATHLTMARGIVHDTAESILDAKERSGYAIAAELIALLAVTTEAIDGTPATTVTAEFDARYRRFSAFRKELRAATAEALRPPRRPSR